MIQKGKLTLLQCQRTLLQWTSQEMFQHDNARPHVAQICTDFLAQNNIHVMDWPPYSPDFSPIKHLWDELDRRVRRRVNVPVMLQEL